MSAFQPDLFAASAIPSGGPVGLARQAGMVDAGEAAELIARIDAAGLAPFRFQGWLGKRLTASFGFDYDYGRGALTPAPPLPGWLLPLRARMAAWAGLAAEELTQALVIRYDPGAGIGWHRDRPQFGTVLGLSLGAPADLRLRRRRADGRFERTRSRLEPGAAYRLDGPARWEWEHAIAPIEDTRWSVTFRTLRQDEGSRSVLP